MANTDNSWMDSLAQTVNDHGSRLGMSDDDKQNFDSHLASARNGNADSEDELRNTATRLQSHPDYERTSGPVSGGATRQDA